MISRLPTQVPFLKPQTQTTNLDSLYTAFTVYLMTIGGQYFYSKNFIVSDCFTNIRREFVKTKFIIKIFKIFF